MVICLGQGADLHMAQLMSLPLTHSCFSKSCLVLAFWYWLTWVVPDKGPLSGCFCVLNVSASTPWEFSKQLGNLELTCNLGNLLKRILGIFTGTHVTEMYLHLSDTQSYVQNYNFTRMSDTDRTLEHMLQWVKYDIMLRFCHFRTWHFGE